MDNEKNVFTDTEPQSTENLTLEAPDASPIEEINLQKEEEQAPADPAEITNDNTPRSDEIPTEKDYAAPTAELFSVPADGVAAAAVPEKTKRKRTAHASTIVLSLVALILAIATVILFITVGSMSKTIDQLEQKQSALSNQIKHQGLAENQNTIVQIVNTETGEPITVENTVAAVAAVCSPSVVTVKVTTSSGSGSGSGVVYSSDGYIITNNHVVDDAVSAKVVFADGKQYPATIIGTDPDTDLALLRINKTGLTPVVTGNSADIRVGELAVAIGNPLGTLANTVTDGIVSALARDISVDGTVLHVMQISCAINPGNSGGGCFNAKGELIGIVNAKKYASGIEGLGFAIPVDTVKEVIGKMIDGDKTILQKSLGITSCYEVNKENYSTYNSSYLQRIEQANDNTPIYGIYIYGDGQAQYVESKNTLMNGDILYEIDGQKITSVNDVNSMLADKNEGDIVTMKVYRLVTSGFWGTNYSLEQKEIQVKVVYMYR